MTWKSTSTSGTGSSKASRASTLFGLDEEDKSSILVYRYRSGCKALDVSTQQDLCRELDADPQLPFMRVTKKPIPRGNSRMEVRTEDLLLPDDLDKYGSEKPTLKSSLANVGLPSSAYWKRLLFNSFPELYIVSRSITPSPTSSKNTSPESSQHVSPSATFPVDTPHPLQDPQAA